MKCHCSKGLEVEKSCSVLGCSQAEKYEVYDSISDSYENWDFNRPTLSRGCAAVSRVNSYRWIDQSCSEIGSFLCQISSDNNLVTYYRTACLAGGEKCFILIDQLLHFDAAQKYCENIGGQLAALNSALDQLQAESLLQFSVGNVWIGAKNRDYVWPNGQSPRKFKNWAVNEPKTVFDCVVMDNRLKGIADFPWKTDRCDSVNSVLLTVEKRTKANEEWVEYFDQEDEEEETTTTRRPTTSPTTTTAATTTKKPTTAMPTSTTLRLTTVSLPNATRNSSATMLAIRVNQPAALLSNPNTTEEEDNVSSNSTITPSPSTGVSYSSFYAVLGVLIFLIVLLLVLAILLLLYCLGVLACCRRVQSKVGVTSSDDEVSKTVLNMASQTLDLELPPPPPPSQSSVEIDKTNTSSQTSETETENVSSQTVEVEENSPEPPTPTPSAPTLPAFPSKPPVVNESIVNHMMVVMQQYFKEQTEKRTEFNINYEVFLKRIEVLTEMVKDCKETTKTDTSSVNSVTPTEIQISCKKETKPVKAQPSKCHELESLVHYIEADQEMIRGFLNNRKQPAQQQPTFIVYPPPPPPPLPPKDPPKKFKVHRHLTVPHSHGVERIDGFDRKIEARYCEGLFPDDGSQWVPAAVRKKLQETSRTRVHNDW